MIKKNGRFGRITHGFVYLLGEVGHDRCDNFYDDVQNLYVSLRFYGERTYCRVAMTAWRRVLSI